jgi:eukaryotic-like serine/threonine-protein kinase
MPSDRWQRLQSLFEEALAREPAGRAAFLAGACPDDPELRAEIESLLLRVDDTGPLRAAVQDALDVVPASLAGPGPGDRVGPYRLEEEIGHGGMGAVYRAVRDDDEYHQRVAVKLLRGGVWSGELLARFRAERQILARLEHPSIARLLDGGTTGDGVPYLVMELVHGRPITEYCDERELPVPARLRLFAAACDAVQYAHQNLVVHRDLKPSNILVTAEGAPKLLDFGIAKLLDPAADGGGAQALTRTQMRVMTPEYASPEQARGERVTTASDVYSLGVLLYELLTGRRPLRFANASPSEIERRLRDEEPPRPSTAVGQRRLAGDLDTIALKALQKDPARRYTSPLALAEDVRRHLDGRPVLARPDSVRYRAAKFVRRHRAGVAAGAAVVVLVLAFAVTMAVQAARLARERNKALAAEQEARQVAAFLTDIFQVSDPGVSRGNTVTAREILDAGAARIRSRLGDQPLVRAALLQTIGNVYRQLGLPQDAIVLLDEALALRRRVLGEDHVDTAASLNDAAEVRREMSDYTAAEPLHRRALAVRTRVLGPDHAQVGESLNNLGLLLHAAGRVAEAEALYRRALEVRRKALGERHELVAVTLSNLGQVARARGDLEQAERLNRDVLRLRLDVLGPDHPNVANSMHVLATTLDARGQDAEAETLFREALTLRLRVLGPDHPDTITTTNNLASALQDQGEMEEAEALYTRSLEASRHVLPPDHLDLAARLNNLASLKEDRGLLAEAEPLYRESLDIRLRRLSEDSPVVARARHNLGRALAARGRLDEGERLLRQALDTRRQALGGGHPDVAGSLVALAGVARERGRLEEAEKLLREALALRRAALRAGHPDISDTLSALAVVVVERGRAAEAETLAREANDALGSGFGEDSPVRARARVALGSAMRKSDRTAEGLALIRRGRATLAARLGPRNRWAREADRLLAHTQ